MLDPAALADARDTLASLVGLPLTDMYRYGCQKFEFGEQKPYIDEDGDELVGAD